MNAVRRLIEWQSEDSLRRRFEIKQLRREHDVIVTVVIYSDDDLTNDIILCSSSIKIDPGYFTDRESSEKLFDKAVKNMLFQLAYVFDLQ